MSPEITQKATIAENLRIHRKQKGWTQEQLSEYSGVAIRTIQRIENVKVEPHQQTLALIAKSLGLEVSELSIPLTEEKNFDADKKWLLMLHLSPTVGFVIPFANLIVPLILWAFKRDDHPIFDQNGKAVVNFHLTVTIAFMAGVAMLLIFFQLGLLLIIFTSAYTLYYTLLNSRRIMKDQNYKYPWSIRLF